MVKLSDTNPACLLVKRRLQKSDAKALEAEHNHICKGSDMDHMTKAQRLQLILDKLETTGTFKHQQAEWERQARTGRNQSLVHDVCKTSVACSTLGSTVAMLTMVNCVKTLTKSVPCHFSTIRTDRKLGKVHGSAVYQLNSLMRTK